MAEAKTGPKIDDMSFEEALDELKTLVGRLESGEAPLDEAIEAYELGARLKAHCEAKLRQAQERIDKITLGPDGLPKTEPFETE